MQIALYNKNGGNLIATVACEPKRDGSYSLLLWEANENKIVKEWRGNFINTDDDTYVIGKPTRTQDGRMLECLVTVAVPAQVGPVTVSLIVTQDGRTLATDSDLIPPNSPGAMRDLFILLKQE